MPRRPPGPKAKGLGAELRRLRERAGLTQEQGARSIGLSKNGISRLEAGQRNVTPDEVAGLLGLYEVIGPKRDQLLAMAHTLGDPGWWELNMPGMTQESSTLADYESRAVRITDWAPLLVPGLLQTEEYARSFMLDDGISPREVESRITARIRRQHRLGRDDVTYVALLGEPVLIGSDVIHRDQLSALVDAANRPNITIRVVPTHNMPRIGRVGAFMAMEVPPTTVVHVEMARSGAFQDDEEYVTPYTRRVTRLNEVALSEATSLRRIVQIRDGMEV